MGGGMCLRSCKEMLGISVLCAFVVLLFLPMTSGKAGPSPLR
jgi:hypothetical protein